VIRAALAAAIALTLLAPVAQPARAQTVSPAIATVDQDRLFADSMFGQRVQRDHEARVQALSQENRQIEAALIEEEQALTDQRSDLPPEDFRALADAFDDKVQRIRAEQDSKANTLGQLLDGDRQAFLRLTGPVLRALVIERGAVALLDQRVVILAAESIDITADAIARIDSSIGDGTDQNSAQPDDSPNTGPDASPSVQPEPRPDTEDGEDTAIETDASAPSTDIDGASTPAEPQPTQPTE